MDFDESMAFNAQSFEFFIISVLRQVAAKQNKDIQFKVAISADSSTCETKRYETFSAVAPNGFSNFDGSVIFEFGYNTKIESISSKLSNLYKKIERIKDNKVSAIIFITNTDFRNENTRYDLKKNTRQSDSEAEIWGTDIFKETNTDFPNDIIRYHSIKFSSRADIKTSVWGADHIKEWIEKYPIDFSNAINNYKSKLEQTSVEEEISSSNFVSKSKDNSEVLKHIIGTKENFALVLGAGVSVSPGAKSWDKLLEEFKNELERSGAINDSNKLCEKIGDSSLITAQLCKELYRNDDNYFWAIHNGLYFERKPFNRDFALNHIATIARLCEHKKRFRIMTYNYDDYLEYYLDYQNVQYNTLFDVNCSIDERLSIYHVHGFLPNVQFKTHMLDEHKKSIYLTEANYNELYNHPYSWQISSQLSFFRENLCLFVGCGLKDPNIRRLLEITKKDNKTHYAILTKNNMATTDLVRASNHFARLGIEVIWVNDFPDISRQLSELY